MVIVIDESLEVPCFGCFDSGRASLSAGVCLKEVVTIMKISSTIKISISEMMITAGAWRRLWTVKRIRLSPRSY